MDKQTIEKFYNAFSNLDAVKMTDSYHDDITFTDPAFGVLKGQRAKAMWHMLCDSQKEKDFRIIYSDVSAKNNLGNAYWEAFYTFSKTGRKVHNKIEASFEFKDGLIINHTDVFSLHKWAKQALGFKGFVLGRTKYFQNKLKAQTNSLLDRYMNEKKLPR
ncbi:nuclear transport factor 2 family protein [Winogradskyella alexanderae]|uniref:Nuclear transport factor 2 family protein n=1 Tax=Winogradskyella alexanderae TaxID=2877123 RepID=A0ABS7XVM0_9FLAO|nr:nuclear transport factor 2 family protein [Winogradskyella alexanderae]MCA0133449.1 nuclear transport factor 2 family protein [Winogradskyella alexanderae]